MNDLGDFSRLAAHVESAHPEGGDLADTVVQNVKGFLDKAITGIKRIDARSVVDFSQVNSSSVADLANMVTEKVQEKTKPPRPAPVQRPVRIRPEIGILHGKQGESNV